MRVRYMIRRTILVLPIAFLANPALAQQPDLAQAFSKEWGSLQAADIIAAASHEHVAELANKLVGEYQKQRDELAKSKTENSALESRLETAMQWLKQAQTGDQK